MSRRRARSTALGRRSVRRLGLAAWLLAAAGPAFAACTPPVAPDASARPEKLVPPVKSACVDNPSGPGCLGWEAYRFNEDVKAFNAKVPAYQKAANAYVTQLNAYVAAANAYAKCEVDALR